MRPRSCLVFSCILLACAALSAQRRPGTGPTTSSTTELRIRIVADGERPLSGAQFLVRLMNAGGTPLREAFTDFEGHLSFGPVGPGVYTLMVSSPQIESTTTEFEVQRYEGAHFEYVRVKPLQNGTGAVATNPMVSAEALKVPEKARKEADKGNEAVRHGDFAEAQKHYRKATEVYPSYAAAENNLGAVCLRTRDFACARDALERAVQIDPRSGHALMNLARLRAIEQKLPQAEALLQRALAVEPANPQALTLMAQAELVLHNFVDAVRYARKVHTIPHGGLAVAHLIAAQALEAQGRSQEAVVEYSTFLQEAPNHPMAPKVRTVLSRMGQNASGSAQRR